MKSWVKWAIGLSAAALGITAAQTSTKLRNAGNKIKAYFTNWRVTKVDKGFVNMEFDYRVLNNNDISVTVSNLFVTIQTKQGGSYKDVMVSGKVKNTITIPSLKPRDIKIPLLFNIQNIPELIQLISFSGEGKAITTFSIGGFELSQEQPINTGDMVKSLTSAASPLLNKLGIQF